MNIPCSMIYYVFQFVVVFIVLSFEILFIVYVLFFMEETSLKIFIITILFPCPCCGN